MGGSSYSDDFYTARNADRTARGAATFEHHDDVLKGRVVAKVHDNLNIHGKVRESRDSDAHPESLAIAVLFDVTGSMAGVPRVVQQKIPALMGLLLRKGYVEHPQVLFGAIGDVTAGDQYPIQIGQFESGAEMDDDLTKVILEGGGGGGYEESYQLGLYFAARKSSIDCFEKRGRKGYLFLMGDEKAYKVARKSEIATIFGDTVQGDVPTTDLVREAQEKYHVFFIVPGGTTHYGDEVLVGFWKNLIGAQNVLLLPDPAGVAELVATTIGINEGTADLDAVGDHLRSAGADGRLVDAVSSAVAPLAGSVALARVGDGDLPSGKSPGLARL